MLVLLVMVIITIPIMKHEIPVDLPGPAPGPIELRVTHRLEIGPGGAVSIDGAAVSDAALPARLAALRADPNAELTVRTDQATRYDRFAQTMAAIRRAGITRLGFVGHQAMLD
jgi:biopolymer transport protein ExbD